LSIGLSLLATLSGAAADDGEATVTLVGQISYLGLDAIPWDSTVHIRLEDVSTGTRESTVAEFNFLTHGQQNPIPFSWDVSTRLILPGHRYKICADIRVLDANRFVCDHGATFESEHPIKKARISLKRIK
jgi:uncharacterized lipoprotein YbaY